MSMRLCILSILWMVILVTGVVCPWAQAQEQPMHYKPTWESLDKHPTPTWLIATNEYGVER